MIPIQQTVVVGLGKTGYTALQQLKQRIQQVYGELPGLRLLVLDVQDAGQENVEPAADAILGPAEVLPLPLEPDLDLASVAAHFPWLPSRLPQEGWQTTCAAARVALHHNIRELEDFLDHYLGQLASVDVWEAMKAKGFELATDRNEASVVVLAQLDDPVASGLLLDTVYLLRHLFRRIGLATATTGVLFLPPSGSPDKAAEAQAYAAMKEVDAYMAGRPFVSYFAHLPFESTEPLFNRGCYLLDTRNESNLSLESSAVHRLAGEWLFHILLSPLRNRAEEFVSPAVPERHQGRLSIYSSLGMTTYLLPVEALIEWCGSRLVQELLDGHLLRPESFSQVVGRLDGFQAQAGLRPDDLADTLAHEEKDQTKRKLEEYIYRLRSLPLAQVPQETQVVLQKIGGEILPQVGKQVKINAHDYLQQTEDSIRQEVDTMLASRPQGGLSLATQFVSSLGHELSHYVEALRRRLAAHQARNQRLIEELSRLGPALQKARESLPAPLLIAFAVLTGFLWPLVLISQVLLGLSNPLARYGTLAGVWLIALGGLAYTIWYTITSLQEKRDQYLTRLRDHFRVERNLVIARETEGVYNELQYRLNRTEEELQLYAQEFHDFCRTLKAGLGPEPLCGEIGFPLQRSVLTPEVVTQLYQDGLGPGGIESQLRSLVKETGTLADWRRRAMGDVQATLLDFGQRVFAGLKDLSAEDLLKRQVANVEQQAREMLDKAAPLWMYDPFRLGQTAQLPVRTLVGVANPQASDFKPAFQRLVSTDLHMEEIRDSHSMFVSTFRSGLPLFALRRFKECRRQYYRTLRADAPPLHSGEALAILPDPEAWPDDSLPEERPDTVFALARAFGLVTERTDGVCQLTLPDRPPLDLLADRAESAALLQEEMALYTSLIRRIEEQVNERGTQDTIALLKKHLARGDLRAWERAGIEQFQRKLGK